MYVTLIVIMLVLFIFFLNKEHYQNDYDLSKYKQLLVPADTLGVQPLFSILDRVRSMEKNTFDAEPSKKLHKDVCVGIADELCRFDDARKNVNETGLLHRFELPSMKDKPVPYNTSLMCYDVMYAHCRRAR